MDFKSYFTETQTIEISVGKIGNQKITKSILNQIPQGYKINSDFNFEGIKIIGFVRDKSEWLIYTENGEPYKSDLVQILELIRLPPSEYHIKNIEQYIDINESDKYSSFDSIHVLPEEEKKEFWDLIDKAERFYTILKSHQIFI